MELSQAIRERGSVKSYDPDHVIDEATLRELMELTLRTPSSFNLQHWRFVMVRDAELKQALKAASWHQSHVGEASIDVIVCGKLAAHDDAERIWTEAGEDVAAKMTPMIGGFYAGNESLQRDEAIRSGSLAAMTLMLAAQSLGLNTCPMIGFDPKRVSEVLNIPADHVPVMMITLGKGTSAARPSGRLPMSEVVRFDTFDGAPLS